MKIKLRNFMLFGILIPFQLMAQNNYDKSKFHQLEDWWPTANEYRNGAGAPGHAYWQQKVDYTISVNLNDEKQELNGEESVSYTNHSPDALTYLWLQLDQNIFDPNSMTYLTETKDQMGNMSFDGMKYIFRNEFEGGYKILYVKDQQGRALKFTIVNTMMRIDLPNPLVKGEKFVFNLKWKNKINNTKFNGGRGGCEYFPEDKNYIYEMAQWFPRLCVYDDVDGWQHKQYLGTGEFALEFGDYKVSITVPADHIVASTGVLQNASQVLSPLQLSRFNTAKTAKEPMLIVTPAEALKNESSSTTKTKTWVFEAENVRDFAWASSRKFIWDAMGVSVGKNKIMAMSYYPKEGNPLWGKYSTHAIVHTLSVYSRYTVDYAYPVAISVNGPIGGMEYPMICFNGPRPEKDGTYSARTKYGLISVVIHEVGHNFFPMIINSDERQWSWMDEGLNTFCQYLAEKEWEEQYPSSRGEARSIIPYMSSDQSTLEPIMTNSESIQQFGNNAYGKPAAALNILRETVMGRELFDYAFKEYANRWAYKHPQPADFFRTMEDASGVDLDWFWRGWFYSTEACDIALKNVTEYTIDSQNPDIEKTAKKAKRKEEEVSISTIRNKESIKNYRLNNYPSLSDFYNKYDALDVTENDKDKFKKYNESLSAQDRELLAKKLNYYILEFENVGGLIMPIIIQYELADGQKEMLRIPAEIWRKNNEKVSKLIITSQKVKQFELDPLQETADINRKNNYFPSKIVPTQFQLFKEQQKAKEPNLMQLEQQGKL
ncbi:MAG: hypothetical protein RI952_380 [Bacteroidota bacterium]|jgi:hypothetical protein